MCFCSKWHWAILASLDVWLFLLVVTLTYVSKSWHITICSVLISLIYFSNTWRMIIFACNDLDIFYQVLTYDNFLPQMTLAYFSKSWQMTICFSSDKFAIFIGSWRIITVVPADQCSPLTSSHGHISTSPSTYGTIVIVTCDVGYVMSNNNLMTSVMCLENGTWNETVEPCEGRKINNDSRQYLTYFTY